MSRNKIFVGKANERTKSETKHQEKKRNPSDVRLLSLKYVSIQLRFFVK
jgi:hypothetical protein